MTQEVDIARYLNMQEHYYDGEASKWSLQNKDPVVGWYDYHNNFPDYNEYLFKGTGKNIEDKIVLEYGCGPGRNLVKFAPFFKRVDGIDISNINIDKAVINLHEAGIKTPLLYYNDGRSMPMICDSTYDIVFAVICLQHIAVHEIRFAIQKEIFRVLKPGGWFCAQMGFGSRPNSVGYFDNHYDASGTNGDCDVRVEHPDLLKNDLESIGFLNYNYDLRDPCQDRHAQWIWFRAQKPEEVN